jgi:N-acetylmuramoyl-L-alanine amidase
MKWMRNFDKATWIVCVLAALSQPAHAQNDSAAARFEAARAQEQRVFASEGATRVDFRAVISSYWAIVRRFPASGYADNALWQAAGAAAEAFRRFGDARDQQTAIRMLEWLTSEYPTASLAKRAVAELEQLALQGVPGETTIRAVERIVLPEVVRVTIALDREVAFYQERLENPARLYFDLHGTRAAPSLIDAMFRYEDAVIREIRLGRHPNSTTRVVLDLEGVSRYSVFTLYDPYRIVIDGERGEYDGGLTPVMSRVSDAVRSTSLGSESPVAPAAPPANRSGGFSVARQLGLGISRIVIDAGHGGHDPGAVAFGISEAELVLDVALRLEKLLQAQPGVEVVLTRRADEPIALEHRPEIANREAADLFLSIHANASESATATGIETYFLNFALNPEAEAVAARENAASARTMNNLQGIINAIALNSKADESRDFAALIQRGLVRGLRSSNKALKDHGVKQAPFVVLVGAAMPSALVEISFVTNRRDAQLLKTPAYRQKIAEALASGISRYQGELKKVQVRSSK